MSVQLTVPESQSMKLAVHGADLIGDRLFGRMSSLGLKQVTRNGERLVLPQQPIVLSDGDLAYYIIYPIDVMNLPVPIAHIEKNLGELQDAVGLPVYSKRRFRVAGVPIAYSLIVDLLPDDGKDALPAYTAFDLSQRPARPYQMFLGEAGDAEPLFYGLDEFVHILITGTSGSGKSSLIRSMLASLMLETTAGELQVALIDGKRSEFNFWVDAPHVRRWGLAGTMPEARGLVSEVMAEVQRRQELLTRTASVDLADFNSRCERMGLDKLPRILLVVDELAFFALSGERRSHFYSVLEQLATLARGLGVHLVISTNIPQTKVLGEALKNNCDTKISGHSDRGASLSTFGAVVSSKLPMAPGRMIAWGMPRRSGRRGYLTFQSPFITPDQLRALSAQVSGRPLEQGAQAIEVVPHTLTRDEAIVFQAVCSLGYFTVNEIFAMTKGRVKQSEVFFVGQRWHDPLHQWLVKRREGRSQKSYVTRKMLDNLRLDESALQAGYPNLRLDEP